MSSRPPARIPIRLFRQRLGSLKGPKHGGANYKVVQMFEDMKKNVSDTTDEQAVADYLVKLLRRRGV